MQKFASFLIVTGKTLAIVGLGLMAVVMPVNTAVAQAISLASTDTDPVNEKAQYPGGEKQFQADLQEALSRQAITKDDAVTIRLSLDASGNLIQSRVVSARSQSAARAGMEAVSQLQNWRPAMQNGNAVASTMLLTINLKVNVKPYLTDF